MTKKEIAEDIRQQYGNSLTKKDACRYLGLSRNTAARFLEGVPRFQLGDREYFLAVDLAARISAAEVG
ncbi:MAG: hypothetical protein IJI06_09785 [Oscillospiraceae bacterium]|nr:hypothetical protein [Oscillospiraceae bacterium]